MKNILFILITFFSFNVEAVFDLYKVSDIPLVDGTHDFTTLRRQLRTFVSISAVHRDWADADDWSVFGYKPTSGLTLTFRAATEDRPDKALWYAVALFSPKYSSSWSSVSCVESKVIIRCWLDESCYESIYGTGFRERALPEVLAQGEKPTLILDNTLGGHKSRLYRDRMIFEWPIPDREDVELGNRHTHTTLDNVFSTIAAMRDRSGKFPLYTYVGKSYSYDAINCIGFTIRGVDRFGVNIRGIDNLRTYLDHTYADGYWSTVGYLAYSLYSGPRIAKPEHIIRELRNSRAVHDGVEGDPVNINSLFIGL